MSVVLRGKVDEKGWISFNVIFPSTPDIDVLLMFLFSKNQPEISYTLIVHTSVKEYDLPVQFLSKSDSIYCLETYGLARVSEGFFNCVASCQTEFLVATILADINLSVGIRLKQTIFPPVPLMNDQQTKWNIELDHSPVSRYTFRSKDQFPLDKMWILFLYQNGAKFFIVTSNQLKYTLHFDLNAGDVFHVKLIRGSLLYENGSRTVRKICNEANTRMVCLLSYYTKVEYKELHDRSVDFIKRLGGRFYAIEYFYRNKSENYFQSIKEYHNNIMKPYKKDFNGDPCSVINGRIDGLFFNTALDFSTRQPLPCSLFGPVRLHVDAASLLTPSFNLYFADFYCHYQVHHVTIVLTPKDSQADTFCKERLISLNIFKNPFIVLHKKSKEVKVYLSSGFRVEIFFTESIDISNVIKSKKGYISRVPILGKGESSEMGIPKNKNCKICNLR